jgi:putrescine transport system substrate-binding protein
VVGVAPPRHYGLALCAALLLALPAGGRGAAAAEEPILKFLNLGDYVAEDTLARFEAETGIKILYESFENESDLNARVGPGGGFDVVTPTAGPDFAHQAERGLYRAIDRAALPNYGNLDPYFLGLAGRYDPANRFAVPYLWGSTGLGYNAEKLKAALGPEARTDSLGLLFDRESARRLSVCGIALLDAPDAVVPAALAFSGKPPMSRDPRDLAGAMQLLNTLRPFIRSISDEDYIEGLATGRICVALGMSGEIVQAKAHAEEAGNGATIAYQIPREGGLLWLDMLAIPAGAPHPENAARFIDFMLRPEIIAAVTNTVGYANANALATDFVDEALRGIPGLYPDERARRALYLDAPLSADYERERLREWERFKAGRS